MLNKIIKTPTFKFFAGFVLALTGMYFLSMGLARTLSVGEFLIGIFAVLFGGIFYGGLPYSGKLLTEATSESMKAMLDRIVEKFNSTNALVIEMTFVNWLFKRAVEKRLTRELFERIYQEAAEELGMDNKPVSLDYEEKRIECAVNAEIGPDSDNPSVCKDIQVCGRC